MMPIGAVIPAPGSVGSATLGEFFRPLGAYALLSGAVVFVCAIPAITRALRGHAAVKRIEPAPVGSRHATQESTA